ncbi:hypothetical protein PR202_gb18979 [Eleusine coracana subsp. coracana]|uniref:Uncharacterized protein n=1 Tax=Eleusine coracana subsp. coracana TaxID=191504 RepID=A0AAV5F4U0_ELECO|nr:hypothetical protein PR202_gb18979 [Eleusine coracana subsp. coracana]
MHPLEHCFGRYRCDGCGCVGAGPRYRCEACDFDLHLLCASPPSTGQFFFHGQHLLTFEPGVDRPRCCDICEMPVRGMHYACHVPPLRLRSAPGLLAPAIITVRNSNRLPKASPNEHFSLRLRLRLRQTLPKSQRKTHATPPVSVGCSIGSEAMGADENTAVRDAPPQPPPAKRPRGKRKALAELPTNAPNADDGVSAPRASKPRTRAAARAEAEAEEARKRLEDEGTADVARPLDPKQPDAGAAQAAVAPYIQEIDEYHRSLEIQPWRRPNADNFEKIQKDISPAMRAVLVDWLVEVTDEFKLQADTLYLTVSKYEEIEASKVKVVKMEAKLLKSLNFVMGGAHCDSLLVVVEEIYLAELSLLDFECVRYLPSVVAAACLFVARFTIQPKTRPWNMMLQQNTGYKVSDLQECICAIHELLLGIRVDDAFPKTIYATDYSFRDTSVCYYVGLRNGRSRQKDVRDMAPPTSRSSNQSENDGSCLTLR